MNIVAQFAEIRQRGNMISVMSVGFLACPKPHVRIPNANRPFAGFSFPRTMPPEPRLASTAFRGLPKRHVASTEQFQILGDTCSSPCIPMARKRVRWNKSKMGLQATTIVMTNKTTHTTIDTTPFYEITPLGKTLSPCCRDRQHSAASPSPRPTATTATTIPPRYQ
jgi:hypothetical protein